MTTASVEFVNLGLSAYQDGAHAQNVLKDVQGTPARLAVTSAATTAGSRPTAPAGARYARVSAIDGNVIAAWGSDPTATQANGITIPSGAIELIPVSTGDKLSFIELA